MYKSIHDLDTEDFEQAIRNWNGLVYEHSADRLEDLLAALDRLRLEVKERIRQI